MEPGRIENSDTASNAELTLGMTQMGELPLSEYSIDNSNNSVKSNKSLKSASLVLHHDPSFSGELDPYTVIILSQL